MNVDNEKDILLDSDAKPKLYHKLIVTTYRVLMTLWFIYLLWVFYNYYLIKVRMNSPLLPEYTASYMFSDHAIKGAFAVGGMLIAQVFHWLKWNILAISLLSVMFIVINFVKFIF